MVCTFFYFCLRSYSVFLKYHLSVDYFITVHLYVAFLLFISNQTSTQSYEFPPCCNHLIIFSCFFYADSHLYVSFLSFFFLLLSFGIFAWLHYSDDESKACTCSGYYSSPSFCLSFMPVFIHSSFL